ncbi:uncharacterized protein H6S33_011716 [Morchella sextelata]|uniref:uncharacterized protein n=1 Tax=Morchella sextelata TaxID=1174677 RepID=UPI001D0440D5|nr:uncharacterized protein H6S33_011716 [Morchella sextelata]KAH0610189.1 hypothetical protein H6S33_011716 [Morchella sextelata]
MSQENPVKIAVVGAAGLIGVRHVDHILQEPLTALSALVGASQTDRVNELANKHHVPIFKTTEELLAARAEGKVVVDAAIVATPNNTHVPIGILLIDNDITALVEKPIAADSSSTTALLEALGRAKGRGSSAAVLVGHHRRFNTYIRAAKKAITSGILGKIVAFQGTWALLKDLNYFKDEWRTQVGTGGPILVNLVHEIDNLRYLFGDIERVYVEKGMSTRGYEVEETVVMTMRFDSGIVGTFIVSDCSASPYNWESATGESPYIPKLGQSVYTILGTKGSLSLPELRRWHYDSANGNGSWYNEMEYDDSLKSEIDDVMPLTLQLQDFVKVHKGMKGPNCSALEACKSLMVIEAVAKSMNTQQPVEVGKPASKL